MSAESPKRILITGLDGFIGHHIADIILSNTNWYIIGLSKIDCASTLHRIKDIENNNPNFPSRVEFIYHDLRLPLNKYLRRRLGNINYIFHLSASTHVDRSIECPLEFIQDNVVGTCNLLDYARKVPSIEMFLYFSTDEVFGPAPTGVAYKEWDRYKSSNPYAATKAAAEELAISYFNTYGLPVVITHTMNVIGERQHPEKFVPKVINAVLSQQTISIHSNEDRTKAGTRFYLHARNVAAALIFLVKQHHANGNVVGDKFNIVGEKEIDNLTLAEMIAKIMGKTLNYRMVDFHSSRPGHDLRYALDGSKLLNMNFKYPQTFEASLEETVKWYLKHDEWLLPESCKKLLIKENQAFENNSKSDNM